VSSWLSTDAPASPSLPSASASHHEAQSSQPMQDKGQFKRIAVVVLGCRILCKGKKSNT